MGVRTEADYLNFITKSGGICLVAELDTSVGVLNFYIPESIDGIDFYLGGFNLLGGNFSTLLNDMNLLHKDTKLDLNGSFDQAQLFLRHVTLFFKGPGFPSR